MLQIEQPLQHIILVLGKQELYCEKQYRLSQFCVFQSVEAGELLYNNLTSELFLLTKEEVSLLNGSNFKLPEDIVKILIEQWFLVPVENDDIKLCEQMRQFLTSIESYQGTRLFTILPTTACNARCFYCFEAGATVKTMDDNTADAVVEYILRNKREGKIQINWFGGEPLCNVRAIDRISKKLSENGVEYVAGATTNGYLFDQEMIIRAKNTWNFKNVQITLDGMPETYKRVKNYINNDPNPFERVINNVEMLMKHEIHVLIRLNLDLHNADELLLLIDLIYARFKNNKFLKMIVMPLYEGEEFVTSRTDEHRSEVTKKAIELNEYVHSLGIQGKYVNNILIKTHACQADKKEMVLINPEGNLGFCEHYVDRDFYGTVYEDPVKPIWSAYRKPTEKCRGCAVLPNCLVLERCSISGKKCTEYSQYLFMNNIYNRMKLSYEKYLKKAEDIKNG